MLASQSYLSRVSLPLFAFPSKLTSQIAHMRIQKNSPEPLLQILVPYLAAMAFSATTLPFLPGGAGPAVNRQSQWEWRSGSGEAGFSTSALQMK